MDLDLNLNSHIKTVTKPAYYNLNNIPRIKGFMSQQDLEKTCACIYLHADAEAIEDRNTPVAPVRIN